MQLESKKTQFKGCIVPCRANLTVRYFTKYHCIPNMLYVCVLVSPGVQDVKKPVQILCKFGCMKSFFLEFMVHHHGKNPLWITGKKKGCEFS